MNRRIIIAAAAALGSALALPASPAAAQSVSSCESSYYDDCLPCEWDDSLLAGDPGCFPPCDYDSGIPANSPYCDPCFYPDSSTIDPSCDEPTTTTTEPEQPTTTTQPRQPTTTTGVTTTQPGSESELPTTTAALDPEGGVVRVDPTTTAAPAADPPQLPKTGGNGITAVIALGLLAAGAALVAASRRPQAT